MGIDPGEPPRLPAPPGPGTLLERDAELALAAGALEEAAAGRGSLIVLDGPAGIGKSRVLLAAEELARGRGVQVLRARCSELERDFAYGAVRQLFEVRLAAAADD